MYGHRAPTQNPILHRSYAFRGSQSGEKNLFGEGRSEKVRKSQKLAMVMGIIALSGWSLGKEFHLAPGKMHLYLLVYSVDVDYLI